MSSAEQVADGDSDGSLSMVDVLAEQARLQEDASAVLGDSDENDCTYSKGYVQRQALYACATCTTTEPAGICLACSYKCHEGHDLYELYTKRFFRCDCGNSKFPDTKCKLVQDKEAVNTVNKYNQNFKGAYCTCARPYPDPEEDVEDEMIQCVICEDWYHGRHLNARLPDNEDYQEMICGGCMQKHPFLSAYYVHSAGTVKGEPGPEQDVNVSGEGEVKQDSSAEKPKQDPSPSSSAPQDGPQTQGTELSGQAGGASEKSEDKRPSSDDQPTPKRLKLENGDAVSSASDQETKTEPCLLCDLQKREITQQSGGTFWPAGWRAKLCRCPKCMKMYTEENVLFLLDEADTVHAYEERGRSKTPTVTDSELEQNALSQMNRIQQVEVLQGFQDLKTELREFLKGFADSGKVVGEEDIRAFFSRMEARKRERLAGLQYHCK